MPVISLPQSGQQILEIKLNGGYFHVLPLFHAEPHVASGTLLLFLESLSPSSSLLAEGLRSSVFGERERCQIDVWGDYWAHSRT